MKKLLLSSLILLLWIEVSYAQSQWMRNSESQHVFLEWDKPVFSNDFGLTKDDVTAASSVLFLSAQIGVAENTWFAVSLPISHFGLEEHLRSEGFEDQNTTIGNLYLGGIFVTEIEESDNRLIIEAGIWLPTMSDQNNNQVAGQTTGLRSEVADRLEAFLTDNWGIPVVANFATSRANPVAVKLRLGTIFDKTKDLDTTLFLLYGITGILNASTAEISLGINGRSPYMGNDPDFFKDGFSQARAGVAFPFNQIVPGFYAKIPVGDNYDMFVDWGYGFNIEYRW